jgi:hypothetical protein
VLQKFRPKLPRTDISPADWGVSSVVGGLLHALTFARAVMRTCAIDTFLVQESVGTDTLKYEKPSSASSLANSTGLVDRQFCRPW